LVAGARAFAQKRAVDAGITVPALAVIAGMGGDAIIIDKLNACLDALILLPAEIGRLKV
jgi:tRNA A22 N-methylase